MARGIKMDTCPTCGATVAKNLAERIRKNEEGYICPGTTTKQQSRKEFEKDWGDDIDDEMNDRLTAQFLNNLEKTSNGAPSA